MTASANATALEGYLVRHDTSFVAEDATFVDMNSGQRATGLAEIDAMLQWVYHVAFEAEFQQSAAVIDDGSAAVEGMLVGRHVGEFAGVPPTHRDVRVPMAIVYHFRDGKIAGANVYMAVGAFMGQVTAPPG